MCRNIRVLHHFAPPTTPEEIRAAALQYVRKVSGLSKPPQMDEAVFLAAIDDVARATTRLLDSLSVRGEARTREAEKARAKLRWTKRQTRLLER
jgi:hypothetical protein